MGRRTDQAFFSGMLYAAAFVLPVGIMLGILYGGGFSPFGDKTLFVMDMRDQYTGFFAGLRNITAGDDSLFFCWSRSMGGNFLGLFAYYLASPLSFLVNLFPVEKMHEAVMLLTLLKIGLCGISFAVYGSYLWNRQEKTEKPLIQAGGDALWNLRRVLTVLPFCVCYALMSYNMVYSLCLMWLDSVILLPAVLLGAEKILDGKKGLHYTLCLAAMFLCNYYTGYMAGIFTGIYFLYRTVCTGRGKGVRHNVRTVLRWGISTVLATGLSAPLLLPAVRDLMQGKLAEEGGYVFSMEPDFGLRSFLGKFRNGVYDSITDAGLPAVYCGIIVIMLGAVFFICRKIALLEKAGAVLVLAVLTMSFYYKGINLIWHGFRSPVWFPYRYAFVFSFFMIYMAFRAAVALTAARNRAYPGKKALCAVWALLLVLTAWDMKSNGQALFDGLESEFGYVRTEEYRAAVERTKPLTDSIRQQDPGLYRVNASYEYSKNDAMLFGFNGMTHYSSTYNREINALTAKLGIAQAHIWNSGYGATPLTESLFAVSYRLSEGREPSFYGKIKEAQGTAAYRNSLALPVVYAADVSDMDPAFGENPYRNQNMLLNAAAGKEELYFQEMEYVYEETETGWTYTLTAQSADPLYLYMYPESRGWADVYANDVKCGNYFTDESTCSLYVGSYEPGQQVTIRVERIWRNPAAGGAVIAELKLERLEAVLKELQAGGMNMVSHKGGKLSGTICLEEGQSIITSIPYDTGWKVWIDGERAETQKFAGAFLAVEAPEGEHTISFSYVSPGFYEGLGVLALSAAGAVFFFGGRRLGKQKADKVK